MSDAAGPSPFLALRNISKRFGGVQALREVDLDIDAGEVHCLAGENGSGKSTLIKIVSGVQPPEPGGIIRINGHDHARLTPAESLGQGIQVIYQDLSLFPNMTVAENIAIEDARGLRLVRPRRMRAIAGAAIERIGVSLDLDRHVADLPIAERQLVAICRAIANDARLLIMDEPTASLTRREVAALLRLALELRGRGVSIVFVSHRLDEVLEIADRVTVLRNGEKCGTFAAAAMTSRRLGELMTGTLFDQSVLPAPPPDGLSDPPAVLAVEGLGRAGDYDDVSFRVRRGEILGIIGRLGSGRTELALSLFGMRRPDRGTIRIDGKPAPFRSNRDAIRSGVAYLSEDRLTLGLVMEQSIAANIAIGVVDRLLDRLGLVSRARQAALVSRWIGELGIKASDPALAVSTLSGGNQQRVGLAKWLATNPRLLILDSPTVGVDIGAKDGIYRIVRRLAEAGLAVIMISDEVPEVFFNCHRVLVMREGRIAGEFDPRVGTEAALQERVDA